MDRTEKVFISWMTFFGLLLIVSIIWLIMSIQSNEAACKARGGEMIPTGKYVTTYVPIKVGSTTVQSPITIPVMRCSE